MVPYEFKKLPYNQFKLKYKKYLLLNYEIDSLFFELIEIDKRSSLTYEQHIQVNLKKWHAQQLDMTNFCVAASLDLFWPWMEQNKLTMNISVA